MYSYKTVDLPRCMVGLLPKLLPTPSIYRATAVSSYAWKSNSMRGGEKCADKTIDIQAILCCLLYNNAITLSCYIRGRLHANTWIVRRYHPGSILVRTKHRSIYDDTTHADSASSYLDEWHWNMIQIRQSSISRIGSVRYTMHNDKYIE